MKTESLTERNVITRLSIIEPLHHVWQTRKTSNVSNKGIKAHLIIEFDLGIGQ